MYPKRRTWLKPGKFATQIRRMEKNHVIRIKCTDQKGLIAGIASILYRHEYNIMVMKEFVETETGQFFARLEIAGELHPSELEKDLTQFLPASASVQIIPKKKKKIVLLVTKEYHCLGDLLVRHYFNELHAEILAVIGNYQVLEPFTQKFSIPFHVVSHEGISKEVFESRMLDILGSYQPDYLVLAKFMRILSPEFVQQYQDRIINIHHSFLPAFIGANPYKKAFERGVKLIGATAHIVNNDLDEGPIITQQIIPVKHDDGLTDMIEAGHEIEKSVLAEALKLVLEDRVFVSGNKTIVFS
jgi:formyltetrahydrofolate deformylase